jgi:hypothetical protein
MCSFLPPGPPAKDNFSVPVHEDVCRILATLGRGSAFARDLPPDKGTASASGSLRRAPGPSAIPPPRPRPTTCERSRGVISCLRGRHTRVLQGRPSGQELIGLRPKKRNEDETTDADGRLKLLDQPHHTASTASRVRRRR